MRKLAFISAVLMFLLSCQPEHIASVDRLPDASDARKVNVTINLSGTAAHTKATVGSEKITKLAVIVRPDYSDISKSWSKALVSEFDDSHIDDGVFTGKVTAYVGSNIFYVIVNYTPQMLSFITDTGIGAGKGLRLDRSSAFSPLSSSAGEIHDAAVFKARQQEILSSFVDDGRGITMMTKCDGGPVALTLDSENLNLTGTLHRMVSRVKMEFATYQNNPGDVVIEGFLDDHIDEIPLGIRVEDLDKNTGSHAGWVPKTSISYCLNAVNTKVYLEPSEDCANDEVFPEDPNYLLDDILVPSGAEWAYADGYGNDFIFWDPNNAASLFDNISDPGRVMAGPGGYLYCLENTVSSNTFLGAFADDMNASYRRIAPRRATTHLLVEVQFIPRYIIQGRDGDSYDYHPGFTAIGNAIAFLGGDGTFWTPDLKHFFNEAGKNAEIIYSLSKNAADPSYKVLTEDDFVRYDRGMCYYTVYIAGGEGTDPDTDRHFLTFQNGTSSVRRDASYTLNATVLHVPAIGMSMMEVNTRGTLDWPDFDNEGSAEIKP